MKNIIKPTLVFLFAHIFVSCFGLSPLKEQPNILFIHVDQMHWQAMSAYGNPYFKTPAMDSYVQTGYGIVPIHYLVDDKGQVQLITMDAVSWVLTAR